MTLIIPTPIKTKEQAKEKIKNLENKMNNLPKDKDKTPLGNIIQALKLKHHVEDTGVAAMPNPAVTAQGPKQVMNLGDTKPKKRFKDFWIDIEKLRKQAKM